MRDSILQAVRALISRVLGVDRKYVEPQTDLNRDLGADSLDKIEVAMQLEDEFQVEISNDDALSIDTVKDAARLVESENQ